MAKFESFAVQPEETAAVEAVLADLDERAKYASKKPPNREHIRFTREVLVHATENAVRLRNLGRPLTADERKEFMTDALADAAQAPQSIREGLSTALKVIVDTIENTGDAGIARQQARVAALEIASRAPATWSPPDERMSREEQAAILADIPRY